MNQCQHCGGWGASHRPECPAVTGWAPADIQLPGGAWVLGWAKATEHQAGAKYVQVRYTGAPDGHRTFHRSRIVLR